MKGNNSRDRTNRMYKIKDQINELDQVVFSGFTHKPAIELSEKLIDILPDNQEKIFFSDNGSTSVDVAIKMALQFYHNQGKQRTKLIALEDAFHGDTFGAMSVSGLSVYNGPFEKYLLSVERIEVPTEENMDAVVDSIEQLVNSGEIAAFIYEPLVQGAAAMKMYDSQLLEKLLNIAREKGVITIADEVMTGFGKTGRNFASDHMDSNPDIICLSKALTAGVAPMAITSCTKEIYNSFYDDDLVKGFFHGHTYSANPLACTAAIAGIDLLLSDDIQRKIKQIEKKHLVFKDFMDQKAKVRSTRVLGVIFALELDMEIERYGSFRDRLFTFFMGQGVFLRPLGSTIYILPPYVITDKELQLIYDSIEKCLELI